jgi:hypothetical protein
MFFISFSFGQTLVSIKEHFVGLHGGYGVSSIFSEVLLNPYDDFNGTSIILNPYIQGYTFGIGYKSFHERSAGLSVELNFVNKGGYNNFYFDTDTTTKDSLLITFKQNFKYIEIPVLTNIRIGKKKGKINIYGGPHIAYLLSQNLSFLESNYGRNYQTKTKNKFDFGLNAGLGYSRYFGKSSIECVIKYSHSLTNNFEQQTINKAFLSQNQVISASLYYYFKL